MLRNHPTALALFSLASLAALLGGCAEEEPLNPICEWVLDPSECIQAETGGEEYEGETGYEDPAPCTTQDDGYTRTIYQCDGAFSLSLAFNTLLGDCAASLGDPYWCTEIHEFGPLDDPYDNAAVIACCDAEDGPVEADTVVNYCRADLVEQVCRSLSARLQYFIDNGAFPVGENQAQKLQNWLADNQQACYDALHVPAGVPGELESVEWLVNEGDNGDWPLLDDFVITLDYGYVESASLPEDPEAFLSCEDNDVNNTEVFEDTTPPSPGINEVLFLGESASASLVGPQILGAPVAGTGRFQSQATGCVDPWCSTLELTTDESAGHWTLEELELYAQGPVELSNGEAALTIDRAAVRLYEVGLGTVATDRRGNQVFTIQAGEAHFLVSGVGLGSVYDLRWGTSASPLTARREGGTWIVDSFVIEHLDREGRRWTITVPSTTWN